MQRYFRLIFAVLGLIVIAAVFLFHKSHIVEAAVKEGQKHGDWMVACNKEKKDAQQCFLTQQVTINDEKNSKPQVVALYQIGYFDNKLKIIMLVPTNVNIVSGTSIISSKELMARGKYTTCTPNGCSAIAEISNPELQKILSNKENLLSFISAEGKQISLPLSNNGLKNGLKAIKK